MRTLLPLLILGALAAEAVAAPRALTDGELDAITAGAGHAEALHPGALWAGAPGLDPAGWPGLDLGGLPGVDWPRWPGIAGPEGLDALRARLSAAMAAHPGDGSSSHTTVTIYQRAAGGTRSEVTTSSINNSVNK